MKALGVSIVAILAALTNTASAFEATVSAQDRPTLVEQLEGYRMAARRSCKAASTCREAVEMWCGGYAGADRDKDGIPCENVCKSKAEVDRIKAEIGC